MAKTQYPGNKDTISGNIAVTRFFKSLSLEFENSLHENECDGKLKSSPNSITLGLT